MNQGQVWINSRPYVLADTVKEVLVQDYSPAFRTQGGLARQDMQGASQYVIHFDKGAGFTRVPASDPMNQAGVYEYAEDADTRFADDRIYPAALVSSPTINANIATAFFYDYDNFNSELYALVQKDDGSGSPRYHTYCAQWTGSTTTWASASILSNQTADQSAKLHKLKRMGGFLCAHEYVDGGNYLFFYYCTDPTSWTTGTHPLVGASADDAGPIIQYGTKIILACYDADVGLIKIYQAVIGTWTWTSVVNIPSAGPALGMVEWSNPDGDSVIWVRLREGFGYLNTALSAYTAVVNWSGEPSTAWGIEVWQGNLYVPHQDDIYRISFDGRAFVLTSVGIGHKLPATKRGHVTAMTRSADWLFAAWGGVNAAETRPGCWAYDGKGWHPMNYNGSTYRYTAIAISSEDDQVSRLHFAVRAAAADTTEYYQENILTNPRYVSGYKYQATPYIYTAYFDAGLPEIKGTLFKLEAAGLFGADETVVVKYGIDEALQSTTSLGTLTGTNDPLLFGTSGVGVAFYNVAFQFQFTRATGTNTNAVKLTTLVLYYKKRVLARYSYYVTLDLKATERLHGVAVSREKMITNLKADRDTFTLIPFKMATGQMTAANIEITDLRFDHQWVEKNDQFMAQPRHGYVAVKLEEPV